MTPATLLANARSLIQDDPDAVGLIDRCNVINRTYTPDNSGGSTITDTAVASNVPCLIERRTFRSAQLAGGQVSNVDHDLYIIASAATRGIKPSYVINVLARSDNPARTFEQPVVLEETLGPLVVVGATLKL
jgi:hypothetical protein